jgi:hypothetical protein
MWGCGWLCSWCTLPSAEILPVKCSVTDWERMASLAALYHYISRIFASHSSWKGGRQTWHYLLRPVKCPRPEAGTLFPHRRMYKYRVGGGINVPIHFCKYQSYQRGRGHWQVKLISTSLPVSRWRPFDSSLCYIFWQLFLVSFVNKPLFRR